MTLHVLILWFSLKFSYFMKWSLLNCVPRVLKTCSRSNLPCVLTCSRANVPCERALLAYVLTCQRAIFDATIFSSPAIAAEVVYTVGKV